MLRKCQECNEIMSLFVLILAIFCVLNIRIWCAGPLHMVVERLFLTSNWKILSTNWEAVHLQYQPTSWKKKWNLFHAHNPLEPWFWILNVGGSGKSWLRGDESQGEPDLCGARRGGAEDGAARGGQRGNAGAGHSIWDRDYRLISDTHHISPNDWGHEVLFNWCHINHDSWVMRF